MPPEVVTPGARKSQRQHRRDMCIVGRWIHGRAFVAATDGNISVRLDSKRILTSPTGVSKGLMTPRDMVITDLQGKKLAGTREPSSELAMHLLIYANRPDVNAVCHAHPPTATAYAAAGLPLDRALLSELVVTLGYIPLARYGTPGTPELSNSLKPLVKSHDAILMANHGAVTCGADLLTAFFHMETLEHFAQVSLATEVLGKQLLLSGRDVEKLAAARVRYGNTSAAPIGSNCPVTSDSPKFCVENSDLISVTREELESLIEEAVRKDRISR